MDSKELNTLIDTVFKSCRDIMEGKGHDYTAGDSDRLINFKSVASRTGVSPLTVWGVYFNKHVDSINTLVKTGRQESGEPVEGRIIDIINYALLGLALIKEGGGDKVSSTGRVWPEDKVPKGQLTLFGNWECFDPNDEDKVPKKYKKKSPCPPGRDH